ncbi:TRAM domain-containing protein [Egibacter rhizosphaerae]|uniref:TRAM domain-containing protein n=1 Tax=Egibacter rhizosphaerae TaxID=1670831 RepID=A0A411YDG8_9ACTN|nr:TRAM domain-containing protein [Egibacter rhizosphaerae]QBI19263.1 TRAM domain-containing protein [Egibacter rhizosphaerae]
MRDDHDGPHGPPLTHSGASPAHVARSGNAPVRGGTALVELVRLAVVVLGVAVAYRLAITEALPAAVPHDALPWGSEASQLMAVLIGAAVGYVAGGVLGRFALGRIDAAERRFSQVAAGDLLAGLLGALAGLFVAAGLTWPLLLVGSGLLTIPLAVLIGVVVVAGGIRIGSARGGDLLRFVGASGRLQVATPSSGGSAKVVDTSALIDGRLLDVCRAGFLDGALLLPRFVLYELQGLADSGEDNRRERGQRGLDVLGGLQRASGVALEVVDRDYPEIEAVDAKLVALARDQGAALVTVDANLGRVAEVQGVRVLNLNALAETLRPPVLPGDVLSVKVAKPGKEAGQGVGYLSDGTMVVIEQARDRIGNEVACEVTSILSNPHGRMVFTALTDAQPLRTADTA